MKTAQIICLDNGGKTFDRFTIINRATGEMLGASENPFSPLGFGQHCGNVADSYWFHAYGYSWRKNCNKALLNRRIKYAVDLYLADCSNVGKVVDFDQLPENVKKYALNSFE